MEPSAALPKYDYLLRIQFAGSISAGKTSIIRRYIHGSIGMFLEFILIN